jgi:hypothetical protein
MLFAINGPGRPEMRATTAADTNFILAKVSGRKTQFAGKTIVAKGQRWPYYYGIQLIMAFSRPAVTPISLSSGSSITTGRPAISPRPA